MMTLLILSSLSKTITGQPEGGRGRHSAKNVRPPLPHVLYAKFPSRHRGNYGSLIVGKFASYFTSTTVPRMLAKSNVTTDSYTNVWMKRKWEIWMLPLHCYTRWVTHVRTLAVCVSESSRGNAQSHPLCQGFNAWHLPGINPCNLIFCER